MINRNLSEKEEELFYDICKYIDENKISPTVRELKDIVGVKSTNTVATYLKKLQDKGYISKIDKSPRSIKVEKF